jgi:hypothetical protein
MRPPPASRSVRRWPQAGADNAEHVLWRIPIKFAVKPPNEIGRRRFWQPVLGIHSVHFSLDVHMRGGFDLKTAALGIVPLNAVIGVHDAHDPSKVRCGARV